MNKKVARNIFKLATGKNMYSYQVELLAEKADKVIINKSRQIGITSFYAFYGLLEAVLGKKVLIVSPSLRQSLLFFEYVKGYLDSLRNIITPENIESLASGYVKFLRAGSIRSLPNSPETIRGYNADIVILDEFAFFDNDKEIWRAVYPMISRGGKIIIISTPRGENGLYFEIWENAEEYGFKKVLINYRQCPDFNEEKIKELRQSMDELSWRQEYENEFLGDVMSYFTIDLIKKVEDGSMIYWEWPEEVREPLIFGVDIGRKRDKTAIVGVNRRGEVKFIKSFERKPFKEQEEFLKLLLPKAIEMRVDETGLGMQLAEELSRLSSKVKPITINNQVKVEGFVRLRTLIENKELKLPKNDELRRALNLIERKQSGSNITFDASRTDETGHSDLAFALMLAVYEKKNKGVVKVFDSI